MAWTLNQPVLIVIKKDLRDKRSLGTCSPNTYPKSRLFPCQQIHQQLHVDQLCTRQKTLHPDIANLEFWTADSFIKGIKRALEVGGIKAKEQKINTG